MLRDPKEEEWTGGGGGGGGGRGGGGGGTGDTVVTCMAGGSEGADRGREDESGGEQLGREADLKISTPSICLSLIQR